MKKIIAISAGRVEYALEDAVTPIEDLIAELQGHLEDGATDIVGLSGNYRGAQWVRLGQVDWLEDDEDDEDDDPENVFSE